MRHPHLWVAPNGYIMLLRPVPLKYVMIIRFKKQVSRGSNTGLRGDTILWYESQLSVASYKQPLNPTPS